MHNESKKKEGAYGITRVAQVIPLAPSGILEGRPYLRDLTCPSGFQDFFLQCTYL